MEWSTEKGQGTSLNEAVLLALNNLDHSQREQAIDEAAENADPEGLVDLIATDDVIRRNAAMEALGRGGHRSVPALVKALADPDPEIVMFAASTLGKTRDLAAVPHLARVLRHADINVCQAAIESLGLLRAASSVSALESLLDGDLWVRFSVVHTLGEIGNPSSVRTLIGLLDDKQLRENAIAALGKIGGPEAIVELVRLLEASGSPAEFRTCLTALGPALAQVPDPSALQKIPAWATFARSAERTMAAPLRQVLRQNAEEGTAAEQQATREAAIDLVRCLRLETCYPDLAAVAADEALGDALLFAAADIGPALGPHLGPALSNEDRRVRLYACRALAAATFQQGAGATARLLTDPDQEIRATAVRVLTRLHCAEALGEILGRLDDASVSVRVAVIEGLTRMDARAVTMALMRSPRALGQHRSLALSIMRDNPHVAQRGFIEACLGDRDETVRLAAVGALVTQPAADVLESLEPLLADASPKVRRDAIAALGARRSERSRQTLLALIERDPETRAEALRALCRIGDDRLVPRLIAMFDGLPAADQTLAVDALGALEAPAAEPFLARQLAHPDASVRRHAVGALARIGNAPALRRLGIVLRDGDPKVRLALSRALASCPHPIARSALERLSLDPVPTVAAAARGEKS